MEDVSSRRLRRSRRLTAAAVVVTTVAAVFAIRGGVAGPAEWSSLTRLAGFDYTDGDVGVSTSTSTVGDGVPNVEDGGSNDDVSVASTVVDGTPGDSSAGATTAVSAATDDAGASTTVVSTPTDDAGGASTVVVNGAPDDGSASSSATTDSAPIDDVSDASNAVDSVPSDGSASTTADSTPTDDVGGTTTVVDGAPDESSAGDDYRSSANAEARRDDDDDAAAARNTTHSHNHTSSGGDDDDDDYANEWAESAADDIDDELGVGAPGSLKLHNGTNMTSSQPHVVMLIVDDMGYNDIGYQSTDLSSTTPNLDKLAANGVKLGCYYSAATCTPARSALHTGLHWARTGMWWSNIAAQSPWALEQHVPTLAGQLQAVGYATHLVGKWDIGHSHGIYWPTRRGFDTFFGLFGSEYSNYTTHESYAYRFNGTDHVFYDLVDIATANGGSVQNYGEQGYSTTLFRDRAVALIESHSTMMPASTPLFLMVAFNAVHSSVSVPDSFKKTKAWAKIRKATTHAPDERAEFAGALYIADSAVGRVIDKLEFEGLYSNSLIVVASDNGGMVKNGGNNFPLRGEKTTLWEGAYRVPAFVHSSLLPDHVRGTTYRHMFHVTDWLPTILLGALALGDAGETDGVSQWGGLLRPEETTAPRTEVLHDIMYLKMENNGDTSYQEWASAALRMGDFKLITHQEWCPQAHPDAERCTCKGNISDWMYNITADPTESNNIIGEFPAKRKELLARLLWHFEHTLSATRYLEKDDHAAVSAFIANNDFVTAFAPMQGAKDVLYTKPNISEVSWTAASDCPDCTNR